MSSNPYASPESQPGSGFSPPTGVMTQPSRAGVAVVLMLVSSALYFLLGVGFSLLFLALERESIGLALVMFAACAFFAVLTFWIALAMRRRRKWAWIVGVIFFALYLSSIFLPIGAIGLWALMSTGTRQEFGM